MAHRRTGALVKCLLVLALFCALNPTLALAENTAPTNTKPSGTYNDPISETPPNESGAAAAASQPPAANHFTTSIATNKATAGQTVRVGFVNQPGSFSLDENNEFTGYEYDYLVQLAQFTGWKYEFVQAEGNDINEQITNSLSMLENGEVDILGNMNYSDELAKTYEYPKNSYGYFHSSLFVADNTTAVTKTNLYTLNKIVVAIKRNSTLYREELEAFCQKAGIALSLVECGSFEEMAQAVNNGTADALLDLDINIHPGFHITATFQRRPIFFAAKKGNTSITAALDGAIERMNTGNPSLQATLYQTYFGLGEADLSLTPEELAYAEAHKPVRVGVLSDKAPIQSFNKETGELVGATQGVLDYITENSGLTFEVVPMNCNDNIAQQVRDLKIDMVAGLDDNYASAAEAGFSLSAPYVTANTLIVFNKNIDPANLYGKVMAKQFGASNNNDAADESLIKTFATLDECFEAVNSGDADYTYANTYTAPYHINSGNYTNLLFLPISISTSQTCFGLVSPIEPELLLILNKSIHSISTSTINSMIYASSLPNQRISIRSFIENNLLGILLTLLAILSTIIVLLVLFVRTRSKAAKAAREETKRHQEIYSISNEQFFEYLPHQDSLLISIPKNSDAENESFGEPDEKGSGAVYTTYEHVSAQTHVELPPDLVTAIITPEKPVNDITFTNEQGKQVWLRITTRIITDDAGRPTSIIGKITDISSEMREKTTLFEKAQHDGLTGLLNRITFEEKAEQLLASEQCGAILIIDVDKFKGVNDTYGHWVGDAALRHTANLLEESFRPKDLIGRLGGDEFAVCVNGELSHEKLEERCETLIHQGVDFAEKCGTQHRMTLSVGALLVTRAGCSFEEATLLADKALYEAKNDGRDCFVIHEL